MLKNLNFLNITLQTYINIINITIPENREIFISLKTVSPLTENR